MKNYPFSTFVVFTILFFSTNLLQSQNFTEIIEYGWGGGTTYAKPYVFDIDGDGLFDMLVGSENGQLLHYEQGSVANSEFYLVSTSFNNIIVNGDASATMADINGNGLLDLLIGGNDNLEHYEQVAAGGYEFSLISPNFNNINDNMSIPVLCNIDNDGLVDLLVGQGSDIGYYEQSEPGSYAFNLIASSFSGIFIGFADSFCINDLDDDGKLDILSSSDDDIYHYEQISPNSLTFEMLTYHFEHLNDTWFNAPFIVDINSDGLNDILIGEEQGRVYYMEKQLDDYISFNLVEEHFNDIDVGWSAAPELVDIDSDGLLDLLVSNGEEEIFLYEQTVPNSFEFQLITDNFNNINSLSEPFTACVDINNNGLLDLLIGDSGGEISHYEQSSINSYDFSLITESFCDINIYQPSKPTIYDLDNDGLLDLIIQITDSLVRHYEQESLNSLDFIEKTGEVNGLFSDGYYYNGMEITDLDGDDKLDILLNYPYGRIAYFEQETPNTLDFVLVDEYYVESGFYDHVIEIADINQDGKLDMLAGISDGNILLYEEGVLDTYSYVKINTNVLESIDIGSNSSPVFYDLDNNGQLDLLIGTSGGTLAHYSQDGQNALNFTLTSETFSNIGIETYNHSPSLAITDIDGDSRADLIIGTSNGSLNHYEQSDTNDFEFNHISNSLSSINVGSSATPAFTDLDGDGLIDIIIGNSQGTLAHYEQESPQSFYFNPINANFNNIDVGIYSDPEIFDIDNDGLLDLLIGGYYGTIYHYEQNEPLSYDFNLISSNFNGIDINEIIKPCMADIDNDNLVDLIIGGKSGGLDLYIQDFQTSTNHFFTKKNYDLTIAPNPTTNAIYINSEVKIKNIKCFDIMGKLVFEYSINSNSIQIPVQDLNEGIYNLVISRNDKIITRKIIVN